MSAQRSPVYSFDGYTVRPVTEQDRAFLELLIESDDYHREQMTADFFLKLQPGEDAWAIEDEEHRVVFYFKTSTVVRIAIQFAASQTLGDRRSNQCALMRGLRWIEGMFRVNRFTEIVFDTEGPELARFATRRLGFVERFVFSKALGTINPTTKSQPEVLGTVPTCERERVG
jgi:hypothetical protein